MLGLWFCIKAFHRDVVGSPGGRFITNMTGDSFLFLQYFLDDASQKLSDGLYGMDLERYA
jgi:hypothetical protein